MLGRAASAVLSWPSTPESSSLSARPRAATSSMAAIASAASSPRCFAAPMALEAVFCSARIPSTWGISSRRRSSSSSTRSMAESAPRRARAARTASGSWRMRRMSRIAASYGLVWVAAGRPADPGSLGAGGRLAFVPA